MFGFSNLNENYELLSSKKKNVIGKFKIEIPKNTWIDEFIALRSKCYAFRLGDDIKKKLKGMSQSYSKKIKFHEYKKCLDEEEYQQEGDNFIFCSLKHKMYFKLVQKSTLSLFDD